MNTSARLDPTAILYGEHGRQQYQPDVAPKLPHNQYYYYRPQIYQGYEIFVVNNTETLAWVERLTTAEKIGRNEAVRLGITKPRLFARNAPDVDYAGGLFGVSPYEPRSYSELLQASANELSTAVRESQL